DAGANQWTLTFSLVNVADPANPAIIASWTQTDAVAAHASLLDGSAAWTDSSGNPGSMGFTAEAGVRALLTGSQVGATDSDRDGMPDAWESAHGFLPDDPSDATQDAD